VNQWYYIKKILEENELETTKQKEKGGGKYPTGIFPQFDAIACGGVNNCH
jgi:hypothetical protein